MKPFGLIADVHAHNWSTFAHTNEDGVNSRLATTLAEMKRAAEEVKKVGGDTIINAGDLFHVRGNLAPSVLNPVLDTHREIIASGINVIIVAGNHDLESRDANRLNSAITALEGVGCVVVNSFAHGLAIHDNVVAIPWHQSVEELKKNIEAIHESDRAGVDLILHAPIDGVIAGLPDHGLTPAYLGGLGFRRVFSGHYHHHKDFGNGVYSIGALTHHTWSDVGSKAGFLIVDDASVKRFASHAPSFIEIDGTTDPEEIPLIVDKNYVRAKIGSAKQKDVEELRSYLETCGALGVVIQSQKDATVAPRAGAATVSTTTLETSVADFIKGQAYPRQEDLSRVCLKILEDVRGVEAK